MEETLDSVDDDELEEEADAEVDKVLYELTDGKLGQAGKVGGELPVGLVDGKEVIADIVCRTDGERGRRGGARDGEDAERDERAIERMSRDFSHRRPEGARNAVYPHIPTFVLDVPYHDSSGHAESMIHPSNPPRPLDPSFHSSPS